MKILIENELFKMQGGTETISIHTYEMLKNNGHQAYFFATKSDTYYDENYEYVKYFPRNVYSVKEYLKNPLAYYYNFEAAKNLELMLKDIKPDLVHLNLLISPSIIDVCNKLKIPQVMTVHVSAPFCPAATFLKKNQEMCNDFQCKNGNYLYCVLNKCKGNLESSIRKAILSEVYIKRNSYQKINKFICPSNALKEIISKTNIGINPNNVRVINNFLSNEELNIKPNFQNKGYFLYIGRLVKEKGVHYLLQAMNKLSKEIELHIIGAGTEEAFLRKYAEANNLNNVKFLGFKNREEIKEEYQNCIATVLPCNWFENFPTTNMESFIHGKPVIASNIGGIPEQVEHNVTGLLFEPANVEQLKNCILNYWNNLDIVIEHGKNAYKKATSLYTEERYYNELMQVYEDVIYGENNV